MDESEARKGSVRGSVRRQRRELFEGADLTQGLELWIEVWDGYDG